MEAAAKILDNLPLSVENRLTNWRKTAIVSRFAMITLCCSVGATAAPETSTPCGTSLAPADDGTLRTLSLERASLGDAFTSAAAGAWEPHGVGTLRGALVERLLKWTKALIHELDEVGIVEAPWHANSAECITCPDPRPVSVPKITAIRIGSGGFGISARVDF